MVYGGRGEDSCEDGSVSSVGHRPPAKVSSAEKRGKNLSEAMELNVQREKKGAFSWAGWPSSALGKCFFMDGR